MLIDVQQFAISLCPSVFAALKDAWGKTQNALYWGTLRCQRIKLSNMSPMGTKWSRDHPYTTPKGLELFAKSQTWRIKQVPQKLQPASCSPHCSVCSTVVFLQCCLNFASWRRKGQSPTWITGRTANFRCCKSGRCHPGRQRESHYVSWLSRRLIFLKVAESWLAILFLPLLQSI